jgi:ATP-binding cassette subfamily B multidrug efflux pump
LEPITQAQRAALRNRAIWRYFKRGAPVFGFGAAALLATNLLALRIPHEIGAAVTLLREADSTAAIDEGALGGAALTIALLALGAAVARVISRVLTFNAARDIEYVLRNDLYEHLLRMPPAWFQRQATGDLVSRVVNDVTQVRLLYGIGVLHLVNTSMAYVMALWLMSRVSVALTLTALLPYPLLLGTMRLFTQAVYRRTQSSQEALSALSARAQENLSGAAVVRAFGIEAQETATFRDLSAQYLARNLALARARGGMTPYMAAVSGIGALVVLGVGGGAVIEGEISLGSYVEFSAYLVSLSWPTIAMGWVLSVWNRGTAAFDRLAEILATAPRDPAPGGARGAPGSARRAGL